MCENHGILKVIRCIIKSINPSLTDKRENNFHLKELLLLAITILTGNFYFCGYTNEKQTPFIIIDGFSHSAGY